MAKKTKSRHVKVDKYQAKATATRGERDKLIASLPSSTGVSVADKPDKKKTPSG
jgi:hypothetical protein